MVLRIQRFSVVFILIFKSKIKITIVPLQLGVRAEVQWLDVNKNSRGVKLIKRKFAGSKLTMRGGAKDRGSNARAHSTGEIGLKERQALTRVVLWMAGAGVGCDAAAYGRGLRSAGETGPR